MTSLLILSIALAVVSLLYLDEVRKRRLAESKVRGAEAAVIEILKESCLHFRISEELRADLKTTREAADNLAAITKTYVEDLEATCVLLKDDSPLTDLMKAREALSSHSHLKPL